MHTKKVVTLGLILYSAFVNRYLGYILEKCGNMPYLLLYRLCKCFVILEKEKSPNFPIIEKQPITEFWDQSWFQNTSSLAQSIVNYKLVIINAGSKTRHHLPSL
uniref:Uncharacterized protein n=1 Tax=Cacopsylla melanoneura TaxID=428564 RepID=A0A8D8TFM4_9HEMI